MNLATRCTACGTVFRVVRDQLRVSEGWVRCGRCDAVFDATLTLFDIDHDEPVLLDLGPQPGGLPASRPDTPPDPVAEALRRSPPPEEAPTPGSDPLADVVPADWVDHEQRRAAGLPPRPLPQRDTDPDGPALLRARSLEPQDTDHAAPVQAQDDPPGHDPAPAWAAPPGPRRGAGTDGALVVDDDGQVTASISSTAAALDGPSADERAPSFVRAADRAAVWRRPRVRAALAGASLLLAGLLAVQAALLWRQWLAAHLPAARPALLALCRVAGCAIEPLRRIELLSVDSSGLNRIEGSALYRLQLVLRNRADTALMMPALDLTLTDNQGRLVARRVLRAPELGLPQDQLERGQELPIRVVLATGERRIEGYTLELFYP